VLTCEVEAVDEFGMLLDQQRMQTMLVCLSGLSGSEVNRAKPLSHSCSGSRKLIARTGASPSTKSAD
jgi:hypothetical protein